MDGALMKLSTRVRYGVRLMISLAEKFGTGPMYLKDIAIEQEISEKYLSLIVLPLRSAGLVLSSRGAHGGYSLAREPKMSSIIIPMVNARTAPSMPGMADDIADETQSESRLKEEAR